MFAFHKCVWNKFAVMINPSTARFRRYNDFSLIWSSMFSVTADGMKLNFEVAQILCNSCIRCVDKL